MHIMLHMFRRLIHRVTTRIRSLSRIKKIVFVADVLLITICGIAFVVGLVRVPSGSDTQSGRSQAMRRAATSPIVKQYGLSSGDLAGLPLSVIDSRLDDYQQLGVSWVRLDVPWSMVQPSDPSQYNWAPYDTAINEILARHFSVLLIIDQTPSWARPSGCDDVNCAPANMSQFAQYVGAVVARYAPLGVHNWEIWNEPNATDSWLPAPNPAAYARMLQLSYTAIKSQQSASTVLIGGLGPATTGLDGIEPPSFLLSLYRHGAEPYFSAVGYHPYSYPVPPGYYADWSAWSQMADTPLSIRSVMAQFGDSAKQIWITEVGAPTDGPGLQAALSNYGDMLTEHPDHVSEAFQATIAQDVIEVSSRYSWAGPVFWYGYQDLGTSSQTNENFFGLLRADGSRKPAYYALQQAIKKVRQ